MKVEEFAKHLERKCEELGFSKLRIIRRGFSFIKLQIQVDFETTMEMYFNQESGTLTSALIAGGKRVFGINGYPKDNEWHRHPLGEAERHLKTTPLALEELLKEYHEVLRSLGKV